MEQDSLDWYDLVMFMERTVFNLLNSLIHDEKAQGSAELILVIGGIIVIILVVVSMYKSYLADLGTEIDSNELRTLNSSFTDIASRFV